MHDEPLNPNNLSPAAIEQEQLDERIVRALETVPKPMVPADFATRLGSRLPARRPESLTQTHYGRNAALLGIVAAFVALLAAALHTTSGVAVGFVESLLLAEFIVLTVWLTIRRHSLR
jgi:hypothetical protein